MQKFTTFHPRSVPRTLVFALTLALGTSGIHSAGAPLRQIPEPAKVINAKLVPALKPTVREWVAQEAMNAIRDTKKSEATIRADIQKRFSGQTLSNGDIDALAFLVLMETSKTAQEDLKAQLAEMQAANKSKAAQRPTVTQLNPPSKVAANPVRPDAGGAKPAAPASAANLSDKTDSLSELGEPESLRLQLAMDRHAKMVEALSNLMKKASETDSAIIGNLK